MGEAYDNGGYLEFPNGPAESGVGKDRFRVGVRLCSVSSLNAVRLASRTDCTSESSVVDESLVLRIRNEEDVRRELRG